MRAAKQLVRRGEALSSSLTAPVPGAIVGASGYVVNLAVFALLTEAAGVHHIAAAICAFAVAVTNNFLWNRHWTFKASDGHAGFQAARFLIVSLIALGFNLIFNSTDVIKFAQGEFVMVGGVLAAAAVGEWHLPLWVAVLGSIGAVSVPSKPTFACVPSQYGLCRDCPQRHSR